MIKNQTEKGVAPVISERPTCLGCGKPISKSTGFYHITYNHPDDTPPTTLEEAVKYAPEGFHLFGGQGGLRWDRRGRYIWGIRIWDGKSYGDKGRCSNCTPAAQARREGAKRMKEKPTSRPRCLGCGKPLRRDIRYFHFPYLSPRWSPEDQLVTSIEEATARIPEGWVPSKGGASFDWIRGATWVPAGASLPPGGDYIRSVSIWDGCSYGNAGHCAECLPTREFREEKRRICEQEALDQAELIPVRIVLEATGTLSRNVLRQIIAEMPEFMREFTTETRDALGLEPRETRGVMESAAVKILHDGEIIGQQRWTRPEMESQ